MATSLWGLQKLLYLQESQRNGSEGRPPKVHFLVSKMAFTGFPVRGFVGGRGGCRTWAECCYELALFRNPGNKILHFVFWHLPQTVKIQLRNCGEARNLTKCQVSSPKLDIL